MKRINKWLQKDQYGVVRGTLLLGAVVLLCTYAVIRLFYSYDVISEKERASQAAQRATAQFEGLIDNALTQMAISANMIAEIPADEIAVLEHMLAGTDFSDAALLRDGVVQYADGRIAEEALDPESISYGTDLVEAELVPAEDGRIQLRVPAGDDAELIAWLQEDRVNATLDDVFIEDYDYAVYNAATGAYIINHTVLDDEGYFEALLDLNQNGSTESLLYTGEAQALIQRDGADGEDYYIAQQLTRIRPLGISLIIPQDLVRSEAWSGRFVPHATLFAGLLMLVILASYMVFTLRRVHIYNKNAAKALDVRERMMNIISDEAAITLFMYQRRQDTLAYCYDGLSLFEEGGVPKSCMLRDIEQACGMDASEAEHLHEVMRELRPGMNAELLVHSSARNHEERILRFTFCAFSEVEQSIVCCISDCTEEQASLNRAELERSYRASVQEKTSSIWQINISRNRWSVLNTKKDGALAGLCAPGEGWRDYNADLGGALRDYLHPADYPAYAETMSIVGIASMFRSGKTEFAQDYRIRKNGRTDYEWHRIQLRIWLNPETNDILANLYVFNVNAEKNAELERGERKKVLHQTLMALGGLYYGLYYVDLENDLSYTARSLGGDLVTRLCAPYKATFDGYIDSAVHPKDRESLRSLLSAYHLRKTMTEGTHFRRKEYRRKSGDGYEQAAIIVQPARFENGVVKEVVLAIRYIGRDKNPEM